MKRICFLFNILLIASIGIAQDLTVDSDKEWSDGVIKMTDGRELRGVLRYNDTNGILSYENGRDSRSLTARSVSEFRMLDPRSQNMRRFYSIEYEDEDVGTSQPFFFEILREFKTFGIASKIDPVKIEAKHWINQDGWRNDIVKSSQSASLYFFDMEGNIEPYLRITLSKNNSAGLVIFRKSTKRKIKDHDIIKDYTMPYYDQLKTYASKQNLSFRRKDDFLKIMDEYGRIIAGK